MARLLIVSHALLGDYEKYNATYKVVDENFVEQELDFGNEYVSFFREEDYQVIRELDINYLYTTDVITIYEGGKFTVFGNRYDIYYKKKVKNYDFYACLLKKNYCFSEEYEKLVSDFNEKVNKISSLDYSEISKEEIEGLKKEHHEICEFARKHESAISYPSHLIRGTKWIMAKFGIDKIINLYDYNSDCYFEKVEEDRDIYYGYYLAPKTQQ